MTYYNEIEPFACDWIANLAAAGEVNSGTIDRRSIKDVRPEDVQGFTRCHWFAGIAGWELALRIAGWEATRPIWTASCPCQPFSQAGKRKGQADERHLWPELYRLIRECRPCTVIGEQVASADGLEWFDGVSADMEAAGYAVGAVDICAASIGAPHERQRLYWLAYAECSNQRGRGQGIEGQEGAGGRNRLTDDGETFHLADAGHDAQSIGAWAPRRRSGERKPERSVPIGNCSMGNAGGAGLQNTEQGELSGSEWHEERGTTSEPGCSPRPGDSVAISDGDVLRGFPPAGQQSLHEFGPWSDARIIFCLDDKFRRVSSQCGNEPLAYGIPIGLGRGQPELRRMAKRARANRNGRLKGYGNAIVPELAAEFVKAVMECI